MRRILCVILCVIFLVVPVQAVENEKLVALTFDDGPSGRFTRKLLAGLEAREVQATFLLCGYRIAQYPELTEQISNAGHEIGLHGYSHKPMQAMSVGEIVLELEKTMALLKTCEAVTFLRAPGGSNDRKIRIAAERMGLSLLFWSVDPQDWATRDVLAIERDVLENVRDGDVILLHDMTDSSVEAALSVVDQLKTRGFRFVTVSELAKARGIQPVPGREYAHFPKT